MIVADFRVYKRVFASGLRSTLFRYGGIYFRIFLGVCVFVLHEVPNVSQCIFSNRIDIQCKVFQVWLCRAASCLRETKIAKGGRGDK